MFSGDRTGLVCGVSKDRGQAGEAEDGGSETHGDGDWFAVGRKEDRERRQDEDYYKVKYVS